MNDPIIFKARETIDTHKMFRTGQSVLVGVSGGPDSVALLHILLALSPDYSLRLGVAHMDHQLRGEESRRDADFVSALSDKLGLGFFTTRESVENYAQKHRLSIEEAARNLRYRFFQKVLAEHGFEKIALGHHRQDSAELILMYLFRGSGPRGISGIAPVRENIVRPLIDLDRPEILSYLERGGYEYMIDSSNHDVKFLRNRIRHDLIPLLQSQYNPDIIGSLTRTAQIFRQEDQWMQSLTRENFERCVVFCEKGSRVVLSVKALKTLPTAAVRRLIRLAMEAVKGNLRGIGLVHVESAMSLILDEKRGKCVDLPGLLRLTRIEERLILRVKNRDEIRAKGRNRAVFDENRERSVIIPGKLTMRDIGKELKFSVISVEEVPDFKILKNQDRSGLAAYMDLAKVHLPVTIRFFRPGDRFSPLGVGGSQKLKDFFINNKIAPEHRYRCPLFLSRGKILWVAGHGIDESVKVTRSTQKVLKARIYDLRADLER